MIAFCNWLREDSLDIKRYSRRRSLYLSFPGLSVHDPNLGFPEQMEAKLAILRQITGVHFISRGEGNEIEDVHPSSNGRFILLKVCGGFID